MNTETKINELLADTSFKSNRARGIVLAKMLNISDEAARKKIQRYVSPPKPKKRSVRVCGTDTPRGGGASFPSEPRLFHVYVIECETPLHFYVGMTTRPRSRGYEHKRGKVEFTDKHGVSQIHLLQTTESRIEALKAELLLYKKLKSIGLFVGGMEIKELRKQMDQYERVLYSGVLLSYSHTS